jgi:hypothetical protein
MKAMIVATTPNQGPAAMDVAERALREGEIALPRVPKL